MDNTITLKEIENFKQTHLEFISASFIKTSYLHPIITVLNYIKSEDKYTTIMVVVPGELMASQQGKDIFADVVPQILEKMSDEGLIPVCLSWSSEAWLRKASTVNTTKEDILKNYDSLPKEEALVTYFESEHSAEMNCKTVTRKGKTVDPDGNLIDEIELSPNKLISSASGQTEGRFANLFKKYMNNKQASKFREN